MAVRSRVRCDVSKGGINDSWKIRGCGSEKGAIVVEMSGWRTKSRHVQSKHDISVVSNDTRMERREKQEAVSTSCVIIITITSTLQT